MQNQLTRQDKDSRAQFMYIIYILLLPNRYYIGLAALPHHKNKRAGKHLQDLHPEPDSEVFHYILVADQEKHTAVERVPEAPGCTNQPDRPGEEPECEEHHGSEQTAGGHCTADAERPAQKATGKGSDSDLATDKVK